jgi:beta-glucanase (GH16 family)
MARLARRVRLDRAAGPAASTKMRSSALPASRPETGDSVQNPLLIAALLGAMPILEAAFSGPASAQAEATVEQAADWRLVFEDNFNGDALDQGKWVRCYWWDKNGCTNLGNNELQWYLPENVSVSDGALRLTARPEVVIGDSVTYDYSSGMVTTGHARHDDPNPSKFEFQYGYAEIRARLPAGQGLWPAFWMLPSTQKSLPEIDVMEVLGQETDVLHFNFHYRDDTGQRRKDDSSISTPDLSDDWHVFAVEWSPERIVWYFDGTEQWRYEDVAHIPKEPMYLILNLAVGGNWPGDPDETTRFPAELAVDYVRVWQRGYQ